MSYQEKLLQLAVSFQLSTSVSSVLYCSAASTVGNSNCGPVPIGAIVPINQHSQVKGRQQHLLFRLPSQDLHKGYDI